MADIHQSTKAYEDWLRRQLGRDLVDEDLTHKHDKMRESPFAFLRATYWRWAETVLEICPEIADAPHTLCVGDIHLENFGTWRDADGRLVWGVNDFDEAAEMPYVLDLVRLGASALVAGRPQATRYDAICTELLTGYREGLKSPRPIVLDRDQRWLRELVEVSEKKREKFWKKIEKVKAERAPPRYRKVLSAAMPDPDVAIDKTARRVAGAGSLGRPRWIGMSDWRGAPVVREAKAVVQSAWVLAHNKGKGKIRCGEATNGRYRAIDPWYRIADGIVVRRLSPNNRKIEAGEELGPLLSPDMLRLMGFDLAGVHLGTADHSKAIQRDLARRKPGWLKTSASKMAKAIEAEHIEWKQSKPETSKEAA